MDNSFKTSFIPKKPITSDSKGIGSERSVSAFKVLTIIILILMIVSSGFLFLYKNYLAKQKDSLSSSILTIKDSFDKDTIDNLNLFDKRVKISKQILNSHIVVYPFFSLLGNLTVPTIQYTRFQYKAISNNEYNVQMSGMARDYKSIALQSQAFSNNQGRYFKEVVFSNLTRNKNNYITFDVEFNIDPELLSYQKNLDKEVASGISNVINTASIQDNTNQSTDNVNIVNNSVDSLQSNTTKVE